MYIVYGIPNCDTIKKAITWLKEQRIDYQFHDYKKSGITAAKLKTWSEQVGWETILNKKGTTWRGLDAKAQSLINNEKTAILFLANNTSAIKRPVIEKGNRVVMVGFSKTAYAELFSE